MSGDYIIRGGAEGRRRLTILSDALGASTGTLIKDVVTRGQRVLDAGCGGGDVSRLLARHVGIEGRVVGIDVDATAIGLAREEAAAAGLHNTRFETADILSVKLEMEFDAVYSRFLLSHLRTPLAALQRMMEMLAPNGRLIIEDVDFRGHFCHPPRESFTRYVALYEEASRRHGADAHLGARLPSLLFEAGAVDIFAQAITPASLTGPVKHMAAVTFTNIADRLLAEGLATRDQIDADLADLRVVADDPTVFMSMPRIVQCWARKPG